MGAAGRIVINLTAGHAEFLQDMDKAAAKIKQFRSHGVSDVQATGAAFRALKGHITDNVTAAEVFVSTVLKAGPLVQAAFPVIGAVALGSVIVGLSQKTLKFIDDMEKGKERVAEAFRKINEPLRITNDELALANARLEQDIAKLEGRPQNNLRIALEEAKVAADKLADSLDKDLEKIQKVLQENEVGMLSGLLFNKASTTDLGEGFKKFQGDVRRATDEGALAIRGVDPGDSEGLKRVQAQSDARVNTVFTTYLDAINKQIAGAERRVREMQEPRGAAQRAAEVESGQMGVDQADRIQSLRDLRLGVELWQSNVAERARNRDLMRRKEELPQENAAARLDNLFPDRMAGLEAQLTAQRKIQDAIGGSMKDQVDATAWVEAQKAIDEINRALKENHLALSDVEEAKIHGIHNTLAATRAETDWKARFTSSTQGIELRIAAQRKLADAIGKGFDATRDASVEARLVQELGPRALDKEWMASHSAQVEHRRSGLRDEFDAEHGLRTSEAIAGLQRQIEMEEALAAVQYKGVEAVRQAALAVSLDQMVRQGATQEQIQMEMKLYNERRENESAANVHNIDQRTAALQRLSDAVLGGAEAERQAALESKYAQMQSSGASGDEIAAQRRLDAAEFEQNVTREALKTGMVYRDQLTTINQQLEALDRLREIHGSTFEIEVAARDLENRRLDAMVQATLKLGTARDGIKAFFIEMQKDARSAAESVYTALNSAFNGVSDNLARLATGQQTNFGQMAQGVGQQMMQAQIDGAMRKGIGMLDRMMPGLSLGELAGKKDGSDESRALWVRLAGSGPALPDFTAHTGGKIPDLGGLFGSGSKGGFVFSMLKSFGGFRADGGPVDPSRAYVIGERGPEMFVPSRGGTVVPNHALGGSKVEHHYHYHYTIDARGSDLGAEGRIQRGLQMTHNAAVRNSVWAQTEREARTPRRG